jgi:hypothetical protein
VNLNLSAARAIFFKFKFGFFAFCLQVNFVPGCYVVLVFTDGTNQSD